MTFDANDVLRVISRAEVVRLERLGATVNKDSVVATEEQLWRAGPALRHELLKAGLLTISDTEDDVGDDDVLQLDGENLQLGGEDLTLG